MERIIERLCKEKLEEILVNLPSNLREKVKTSYDVKNLTWFKTGGKVSIFFKPDNEQDLQEFLLYRSNHSFLLERRIFIIGAGSNLIIDDGYLDIILIKLGRGFNYILKEEKSVSGHHILNVGSSVLNFNLAKYACENSLSGCEFLYTIPGSVGGGVFMNAGAYGGDFANIVEEVNCFNYHGEKFSLKRSDINYQYRNSNLKNLICISAKIKLLSAKQKSIQSLMEENLAKRQKTQPLGEKTGGSSFVNPLINGKSYSAWKLIDDANLRGYRIGGASVSQMHTNFIINDQNASSQDLINLILHIQNTVYQKFDIILKTEIKIISNKAKSSISNSTQITI